ncbi:glutathione S-transferase C-terminal domain-containing protein [Devosia sp. A8/3-2]|nr:glutathione S-transferase C-terminal domain-containing protein [Devosia sp. A8/3-2]
MHSAFLSLRSHAPMNLRASHPGKVNIDTVGKDLHRLETLLGGLLSQSGGPFLFGEFTAADAMFAPVATRIRTYGLPVSDVLNGYVRSDLWPAGLPRMAGTGVARAMDRR